MHRTRTLVMLIAAALALAVPSLAQVAGRISDVTVYRGQALVTRELDLNVAAGAQEIVVSPLPQHVIPQSLYATSEGDVTVRAVRFRITAVGEEPREEVRKLDEQIEFQQGALREHDSKLGVLQSKSGYLDKLENFVAATVTTETGKGVLDPKALMETSQFIFTQRAEIAQERLALERKKNETNKQLQTLNRQRNELMAGSSKTQREAVLSLDAARARQVRCRLFYLVQGVNWSPGYSARLNDKHDKLALEYHAVVSQASGEDWPNVRLTLSTTRPTMVAETPLLSPLWINLVAGGTPTSAISSVEYTDRVQALNRQLRAQGPGGPGVANDADVDGYQQAAPGIPNLQGVPQVDLTWEQNVLAGKLQSIELSASDEAVRKSGVQRKEETEGLAVSYALPGTVSLQSRSDQQMFRIATLDLKADSYFIAVPLLSDYVYLASDAINTSDTPLLPGPYNAYVDGSFAGRGMLPLVARGQNLTVGFGTETQLRASRELVDKSTDVRGGNQLVTYNYRLRLDNLMRAPVKVRLWDRIPQAPDNMVTINLPKLEPALSKDTRYLAEERPHGLLRWDLELPAQASGLKATEVTYQLVLEHDKNYRLGEMPSQAVERMKQDFDSLMMRRNRR